MDFIILKVNGTDVSSFPHEDAVRAFLTAQEPIVVEVKRRISESSQEKSPTSTKLISTGCQTELSGLTWLEENSLDCLTHDIDLEEVTLRKCSSDEKLGLTVCYSSGSEADTCTEVYIRDIAPQSVADRDGRLRQGDQILQVNGKDVANKEETESLFAENRKAVTLLVSRCYNRSEEYLDAEPIDAISPGGRSAAYQNSLIEQLVQQQTESQHSPRNDAAPKVPPHFIQERLNLTNSLVRSKMDSINHEISELDHRMQNIQLVKIDKRKPPQLPHVPAPQESDTEHIYETIPESVDSEMEPIYSCPYEADEQSMIEQWLKSQDQGWTPQAKEAAPKDNKKQRCKSSKSNSSGEEHENSSSAYNTGGSCNSNPLTFELACSQDSKQKDTYRSTLILCPPSEKEDPPKEKEPSETCDACKQQTSCKKKTKSTSKTNSPSSPTTRLGVGISPAHILSDTMYTNVANLQQTMLLQQQLFRQALVQNTVDVASKPTTSFTSPSLSQYQFVSGSQTYTTQPETATLETRMEWKVKRRPDGTRYIARRPVRNRILKNRAIKISEERAGLTTEDDTISELKIGRYWTKEERKKHLEKSKERKQRQEILLASRNIEENGELVIHKPVEKVHSFSSKKAANNLDNTVKKHKTKRTHKEGYDNFPTVQEMIVHGPKVPTSNSKMMGLLSVTTV
ncbi:E3 ubiquitin-protein ligase PDZRN3-like [Tenebrio molitor]|jgi:ligand of Numb protein X 3/4|uniref:E3 ubiquitin-protein ligase PDZRN3-like n=1 Tax=Tenebrio molitor TaxID=7067 RepID=UPI001C3B073F|nr:unnamed protein product [Tenebrio molitor]